MLKSIYKPHPYLLHSTHCFTSQIFPTCQWTWCFTVAQVCSVSLTFVYLSAVFVLSCLPLGILFSLQSWVTEILPITYQALITWVISLWELTNHFPLTALVLFSYFLHSSYHSITYYRFQNIAFNVLERGPVCIYFPTLLCFLYLGNTYILLTHIYMYLPICVYIFTMYYKWFISNICIVSSSVPKINVT